MKSYVGLLKYGEPIRVSNRNQQHNDLTVSMAKTLSSSGLLSKPNDYEDQQKK